MSAVDTWRTWGDSTPTVSELDARRQRYALAWSFVDGTAFAPMWQRRGPFRDLKVYKATRMLYSHISAVVTFYGAHVYQGALATDGLRLPDGSRGAIPIDPQTGNDATNAALLRAVSAWWTRVNWQQAMSLRPTYASALGSVLTELIDDVDRHAVWPQLVWPGYVVDLALDPVGNVKAYATEYPITVTRAGREISGLYRKEVTGGADGAFRYYLDDRPWSDPEGHGDAEQENPYGFVPAVWDRHRLIDGDHGLSAFADTLPALLELNSLLSHGKDYQHKAFRAPVGVKGWSGPAQTVVGPGRDADPTALAESMGFIPLGDNGGIEQLSFDVGQTLEMLEWIKAGILESNPEATFYHQLREMSQLTGPAVERALGDATSRVTLARHGYDTQTIKLHQMAIAMSGYRLNSGAWGQTTPRDQVYRPFDLQSYTDGALDMTILARGVVPQTEAERLELLLEMERIETPSSWEALGLSAEDAAARIAERRAALLELGDMASGE